MIEEPTAAPEQAPVSGAEAAPVVSPATAEPAPEAKVSDASPKTIADAEPAQDGEKSVAPDWPEDWREKLASGDDKMLARLKRFQSPANVLKSWRELEQKVSSGTLKAPLDANATPEQAAAWRKENGIPEKPEEYKLDLGGIVPAEADKPIIEGFKKFAHGQNWTPDQANKAAQWYYEAQEQASVERMMEDRKLQDAAVDELRAEWGNEYQSNRNVMKSFGASSMPAGLYDRIIGGRLADGTIAGNDTELLRWLVTMANEINPGAGLMPAGTANVAKGVEGRIAEIEQIMRQDQRAYWSNPALQSEYARLVEARMKTNARAA